MDRDRFRIEQKIDLIMMALKLPINEPAPNPLPPPGLEGREMPFRSLRDMGPVDKTAVFGTAAKNLGLKDMNEYSHSKIKLIKEVRSLTGLGLKESKMLVDEFVPSVGQVNHPNAWR